MSTTPLQLYGVHGSPYTRKMLALLGRGDADAAIAELSERAGEGGSDTGHRGASQRLARRAQAARRAGLSP